MKQTHLATVAGRLQHDEPDTEAKRQRREASADAATDVQALAARFCAAELHLLGLPQLARVREALDLAAERARTMHRPDWSVMPADIWYLVLRHCSAPMATAVASTCRSLRAIVKHRARRIRLTLTHMISAQQQCSAKLVIDRHLLYDKQYITFVGPVCRGALRMLLDELRAVQKDRIGYQLRRLKLVGGIINGRAVSSIRGDPIYYAPARFNRFGVVSELRLQTWHPSEEKQALILVESIPHHKLTNVHGASRIEHDILGWPRHYYTGDMRRVPHSRPLPSSPRRYGFFWRKALHTVYPLNLVHMVQWGNASVSRVKVDNITLFRDERTIEEYIGRTCAMTLCITMRLYGTTHSVTKALDILRNNAATYLSHFKETRLKIVHASGVVERWHMTGDLATQYRQEILRLQE